MKRVINIKLYEKNKMIKEYSNINSLINDERITFNIDNTKNILSSTSFIRENNEYIFNLNITKKECFFTLKEKDITYKINVEKVIYSKKNNNITLEYKIESQNELLKINIEIIDR